MSLKDDLIAAKTLIDSPDKWIKGRFLDYAGRACARGACALAVKGPFTGTHAGVLEDALSNALPPNFKERGRHIVARFNDHPDTTHADIMALFQRAIEAAP